MGAARRVARLLHLGTIDRVGYDNYEPLIALAAAAAVTERIGLSTTVLLAPLRTNAVELAKQALSVNALSGGRLTLGIGLGAREDDYEVSGVELKGRGKRFDAMLEEISGSGTATRSAHRPAGAPVCRRRPRRRRLRAHGALRRRLDRHGSPRRRGKASRRRGPPGARPVATALRT